jgi:hypothetical protein
MISMAFVEQPESVSTRHHQTVNHARAAATPSVIGGPGSGFGERLLAVAGHCVCAQCDDWNVARRRVGLQPPRRLQAVDLRQFDQRYGGDPAFHSTGSSEWPCTCSVSPSR